MVVLKLSRNGCAVFRAARQFRVPAFRVPVVDTTGAGDCFVAGFLAALDRGLRATAKPRASPTPSARSPFRSSGSVEGVRTWEETEAWMRVAAVSE